MRMSGSVFRLKWQRSSSILYDLVSFDLSGWHEHERTDDAIFWDNPEGEVLSSLFTLIVRAELMVFERGERSISGVREAALTPQFLQDGKIRIRTCPFYKRMFKPGQRGYMEGWFQDPYDPSYRGVILCSAADNEAYDSQFPHHPLSRVRSILTIVRRTIRFADAPKCP
jgi:hypothetical protein